MIINYKNKPCLTVGKYKEIKFIFDEVERKYQKTGRDIYEVIYNNEKTFLVYFQLGGKWQLGEIYYYINYETIDNKGNVCIIQKNNDFGQEDFSVFNDKLELHNEDGPAKILGDNVYYFINGFLHREDGPACIFGSYEQYWIHGKFYESKDHYDQDIEKLKNKNDKPKKYIEENDLKHREIVIKTTRWDEWDYNNQNEYDCYDENWDDEYYLHYWCR